MRLLTVTDSDIVEALGFEAGALGIVFKSSPSTIYRYENVSPDTFACLVSAQSVGKLVHDLFRKTKYPFTKSLRSDLNK